MRRALDAGRSGTDMAAMFVAERSRTPVPQALQLPDRRPGPAARHAARRAPRRAYLRCDDEALLARVLADRDVARTATAPDRAHRRRSRRAPVARVLDVLREAGYAPAAEAPDGEVIALGAEAAARAVAPAGARRSRRGPPSPTPGSAELVSRVRSGDALTEISRRVHRSPSRCRA